MTIESARIHALKNKLAVILGFCELLASEMDQDNRHRPDVLQIQDAARAALRDLPPLPAHDSEEAVHPERANGG
jgi:hypothetical protein